MYFARLVPLGALLLLAGVAAAGDFRREAMVMSMRTVPCQSTGVLATLSGSPPAATTCSDYVVVSETVEYRIRPHKHQVLLPVGEPVKFRFTRSHLMVRPDDGDQDYEFDVISMELRDIEPNNVAEKRLHALRR